MKKEIYMNQLIWKATRHLAYAAKGDPVTTTLVVGLFWFLFNLWEAFIEKLLFGEAQLHWLDPIFGAAFIAYAAAAVVGCALYNIKEE